MDRLSRRQRVLALAAVGVVAALAFVFLYEPIYRARPLTYWVDQLWRPGADQDRARAALRAMGPRAVPHLLDKARSTGPRWRSLVMWEWMPSAVQELLPDPRPRDHLQRKIPYAISLIGAPAVPRLVTAMQDPDRGVRMAAAQAIACLGERANGALPGLVALLEHQEDEVRADAALAISQIGTVRTQAIPALILTLRDNDRGPHGRVIDVRQSAARALGAMGPAAKPAASELKSLLEDPDPAMRLEAATALWRIERDTNLVQRVAEQLEKPQSPYAYRGFVDLLAQMGPAAQSAVPGILRTSTNWGPGMARSVRRALSRIDPSAGNLLGASEN